MAKRTDIKKILIIGSGPIIIGQACEFDYSGTQACKALRSAGYEIVLVNSNPATIMTDPGMADHTYIEPLTAQRLEQIIAREKPDALLPNLGGQTALNLSSELHEKGILAKYNVKVIGVDLDAIKRGEDRIEFKKTMASLGVPVPHSEPSYSVEEAEAIANKLGYPVVLRPAYTMGGTGGIVYNVEELRQVMARGLAASLIGQVLVEECVLGWEELELEVVRDAKGQKITVCFIENVDPMGVHTGDSFCVAPMLTVPREVQAKLQDYAYRIVDAVGVTGGTNVQFAHNREDNRIVVIEINPRTSRSSALASKATGFPIAHVSTLLATGMTLDEIPYWRRGTLEKYEPYGDYVVVKFARWAFEKFPQAKTTLGTQMKAVGEVMSIGKNFKEAFQKAIRSLEIGRSGLGQIKKFQELSLDELKARLVTPTNERYFLIYEAMLKGMSVEEIIRMTSITPYFIEQMREIADCEVELSSYAFPSLPDELLRKAKLYGFSDKYLAKLFNTTEKNVRERRKAVGMHAKFQELKVSGVKNAAYYYSTYALDAKDEVPVSAHRKIMVLGGGPNRIGQGIEFDYCCCHASFALRAAGFETVMVNSNPETVSTDYDTSDKLYFEPLTLEDVLPIYRREKCDGVIVQFGGQTPLNLADGLKANGANVIGTAPEMIDAAEDRRLFAAVAEKAGILQPPGATATTVDGAAAVAAEIGYPVLMRPSFVLGGRAMVIVHDEAALRAYMKNAVEVSESRPVLIDRYLGNATEVDVDCISDGETTVVGGIMEHVEYAGIHSGDSACMIPAPTLSEAVKAKIRADALGLASALRVRGLMNIQFAVRDGEVFVLEANPRASRTVPFVSKATGVPLAKLAARVMTGTSLRELGFTEEVSPRHTAVKEAVFPFARFPGVDVLLSPEMKSTGEVMGLDRSAPLAYLKSQIAAGTRIPRAGKIFVSVRDEDKEALVPLVKRLLADGYEIYATRGTSTHLWNNGVRSRALFRVAEGRPNLLDLVGEHDVAWIITTPSPGSAQAADDIRIRSTAVLRGIPVTTTLDALRCAIDGLDAFAENPRLEVCSLQEYQRRAPKLNL